MDPTQSSDSFDPFIEETAPPVSSASPSHPSFLGRFQAFWHRGPGQKAITIVSGISLFMCLGCSGLAAIGASVEGQTTTAQIVATQTMQTFFSQQVRATRTANAQLDPPLTFTPQSSPSATVSDSTPTSTATIHSTSTIPPIIPTNTSTPQLPPTHTPVPPPTAIPYSPPLSTATPIPQSCGAPANPWGYNFCGGNTISNPPSSFCDYFNCISSFWNSTNGYVEQCQDGAYSHSGGRSGSCSYHKGNYRPLYGP